MPATTPVYGWSYPVGTDRVMDGDNAIQTLALAVEGEIKPAYARLQANATQALSAGTATLLTMVQVAANGCTVAGSRVTVGRAGVYVVTGICGVAATTSAYLMVYVNAAALIGRANQINEASPEISVTRILDLAANDVVDLRIYSSAAANVIFDTASRATLELARIGAR